LRQVFEDPKAANRLIETPTGKADDTEELAVIFLGKVSTYLLPAKLALESRRWGAQFEHQARLNSAWAAQNDASCFLQAFTAMMLDQNHEKNGMDARLRGCTQNTQANFPNIADYALAS
jgi:hypothetical protein